MLVLSGRRVKHRSPDVPEPVLVGMFDRRTQSTAAMKANLCAGDNLPFGLGLPTAQASDRASAGYLLLDGGATVVAHAACPCDLHLKRVRCPKCN